MKTDNMDDMLKTYFSRQKDIPGKGPDCPSLEALEEYVSGLLEADSSRSIAEHVKGCARCDELIEGAAFYSAYGEGLDLGKVPAKIRKKAKSLHPSHKTKETKIMTYLKRNAWLAFSLASLAVSFFTQRYFLQFLILAVILGLKWIFNKESARTLIMIYNAWKKHDKTGERELEEIFKNRL